MSKTNYTMLQIKKTVEQMMWSSISEYTKGLEVEAKKSIEESPEITCDIVSYKKAVDTVNSIFKKYNKSGYSDERVSVSLLEQIIKEGFSSSRYEEKAKIKTQFNAISNKLKNIRNADSALEFLKLCGINFPESEKVESVIPVDPEFIKSILPKNKMLT